MGLKNKQRHHRTPNKESHKAWQISFPSEAHSFFNLGSSRFKNYLFTESVQVACVIAKLGLRKSVCVALLFLSVCLLLLHFPK